MRFETLHGDVLIYDVIYDDGRPVTVMDTDGAYQSATYHDDACYELVFDYHRAYDHVFDGGRHHKSFLMLGGGGYAYPKHIIATRPDALVDVVEIDPMITMLARRYFYLERLYAEFDLYENERMRIFDEDARAFLESPDRGRQRYDVVVSDCFVGRHPVMSLATLQAAQLVHGRLAEGGVFASNVIGSLAGESSGFIASVCATLSRVFEHVAVIPASKLPPTMRANNIVIATDSNAPFADTVPFSVPADTNIFLDRSAQSYESLFIEDADDDAGA